MNKTEKQYCKYLGEKIRIMRTELQKSLRQFALECEIPIATLSRIENGHREAGFITMKKLAEGFGMTFPDFVSTVEATLPEKFSIYEE
ncbi:helix-turn-helix transcriptional regulator [bacterium]|nr:helix-turn-helix transcriptional regulator [bacterium]